MNDSNVVQYNIMKKFLLGAGGNFILKGGTALMMCYGLTRFSEDIDLDALGSKVNLESYVNSFCVSNDFTYSVVKNTDTVKRYKIHYGASKPLKVEISYRRKKIESYEYCIINGILVYNIAVMFNMKLQAYSSRDKIRDLYDIVFICKNYWGSLNEIQHSALRTALSFKGLGHFDYLIATQDDGLIDKIELGNAFLDLYMSLEI